MFNINKLTLFILILIIVILFVVNFSSIINHYFNPTSIG